MTTLGPPVPGPSGPRWPDGAAHAGRPEARPGEAGWHPADPTDEDPELRAQADEIEARWAVSVSVRFGFFRADRADVIDPAHWEADDAEGLRRQLPSWLLRFAPSGQGARP